MEKKEKRPRISVTRPPSPSQLLTPPAQNRKPITYSFFSLQNKIRIYSQLYYHSLILQSLYCQAWSTVFSPIKMYIVLHLAMRGQQRPGARWSCGLVRLPPRKKKPGILISLTTRPQKYWECTKHGLSMGGITGSIHSIFDE